MLESIGPAARAIRKIKSSNIAQTGKTILEVSFLEIDNICSMTESMKKTLGSALGIFIMLRQYFSVYPSSCHTTDTLLRPLEGGDQALIRFMTISL